MELNELLNEESLNELQVVRVLLTDNNFEIKKDHLGFTMVNGQVLNHSHLALLRTLFKENKLRYGQAYIESKLSIIADGY